MKTNDIHEGVARIARRSLVLAGLLVMALVCAGTSRAQSSAASAQAPAEKPADAAASHAQAALVAPQAPKAAATAQPTAPAEKNPAPQANSAYQGITVHGHWTIEVRNPDGSPDKHVEFENKLCTSQEASGVVQILSTATPWFLGGGDAALADLFVNSVDASGQPLSIGLYQVSSSATVSACTALSTTSTYTNSVFYLAPPAQFVNNCRAETGYKNTLNVFCFTLNSAPVTSPPLGFTLSGQLSAVSSPSGPFYPATIGAVGTLLTPNCVVLPNPAVCGSQRNGTSVLGAFLFTAAYLPTPVTIQGGQTVSVTVLYTFQ
jgi:hypothetical protein